MARTRPEKRRAAVLTSASRVGFYYLAAGVLWILLSDLVLAAVVPDPDVVAQLQTFKGWAFVAVSAGLIWWLVRREVRRTQRSEAWLSAFAEQGMAGIYLLVDGRFSHVNRRFAEIFGYSVEEMLGMHPRDLVVEEERDHVTERVFGGEREAAAGVQHRAKGVRQDGSTIDLEAFGRAIDLDGQRVIAGLLLDVSERVRLEDKLRQAARLDALGNLTGAVAHDFNNFLTGIIGNLDLMLSDPHGGPPTLRADLELVRDSAARAAALTGQLLTFGRGRIFHHRPIDPNRHLRKLSAFLDSLCHGTQVLVLDLAEGMPSVVIDPVALDQLVVNLFVNAKEAIGSQGTITVRTRMDDPASGPRGVVVEVSDDGSGMPQEVLDRIFEPFFTTKERGTGLGLATVRSITDEVHGHLSVDSAAGRGTAIQVWLPAGASDTGDTSLDAPSPRPLRAAGHSRTVLIVDDDAAVRKVVAAALKRVGYHTLVASTAHDAERTIEGSAGDIDLLVCDVHLSDRSGTEFAVDVLQKHGGMRVLFMSGTREPEMSDEGSLLRAAPFLEKPFSLDGLRGAVEDALGGERPRRERFHS